MSQQNLINFLAKQTIEEFMEYNYEELNNIDLSEEDYEQPVTYTQKPMSSISDDELPF